MCWLLHLIFLIKGLLDSKTVKKFGVDNIMRAAILVWYWCAHDENSQVNGTAVLFDLTELSLYFCTHVWNVENLRRKLKFYEVRNYHRSR